MWNFIILAYDHCLSFYIARQHSQDIGSSLSQMNKVYMQSVVLHTLVCEYNAVNYNASIVYAILYNKQLSDMASHSLLDSQKS